MFRRSGPAGVFYHRSPVVDGGAAYVRFCSLERCSVSSHAKQKVPVESQKMGWYLEAGGAARAGICLEIFFPAGSEGPIGESAEPLLVGERGLKLTFGQWQWLFNEWPIWDAGSFDDSLPSAAEELPEFPVEASSGNERDGLGPSRVPPDIDTSQGTDSPAANPLDPASIESFLQALFTTQNAQVSKKLKEQDLSLRAEFRKILNANAERVKVLQAQNKELGQANASLQQERDHLRADQMRLPNLQNQYEVL